MVKQGMVGFGEEVSFIWFQWLWNDLRKLVDIRFYILSMSIEIMLNQFLGKSTLNQNSLIFLDVNKIYFLRDF